MIMKAKAADEDVKKNCKMFDIGHYLSSFIITHIWKNMKREDAETSTKLILDMILHLQTDIERLLPKYFEKYVLQENQDKHFLKNLIVDSLSSAGSHPLFELVNTSHIDENCLAVLLAMWKKIDFDLHIFTTLSKYIYSRNVERKVEYMNILWMNAGNNISDDTILKWMDSLAQCYGDVPYNRAIFSYVSATINKIADKTKRSAKQRELLQLTEKAGDQYAMNEMILIMFQNDNNLKNYLKEYFHSEFGSKDTDKKKEIEICLKYLKICFPVRDVYPKSYETVLIETSKFFNCDSKQITKFVRGDMEFKPRADRTVPLKSISDYYDEDFDNSVNGLTIIYKANDEDDEFKGLEEDVFKYFLPDNIDVVNQLPILENVKKCVPNDSASKGFLSYFKEHPWKLMFLVSLLFALLDVSSDVTLTKEYLTWNNTKEYGLYNENCNGTYVKAACKVSQIDKDLPFYFSVFFILLTTLLELVFAPKLIPIKEVIEWMKRNNFLGSAARPKLGKLGKCGMVYLPLIALWILVGLMLKFVVGFYKLFIDVQMNRFSGNFLKRKKLNQEPFPEEIRCEYCVQQQCTKSEEVCVTCGYYDTPVYNIYEDKIKEQQSKWSNNYANVKLLTTALEDTYLPILQTYLLFPLVSSHYNEAAGITFERTNSFKSNVLLIHTTFSLTMSILNIASALTSTYFSRKRKLALGNKISARIMYFISSILMICGRLVLFELFGIMCFSGGLALIWMSVICFTHCLLVFFLNLTLTLLYKRTQSFSCKQLVNILLSSCASAFIFSQLNILNDDRKLTVKRSNIESEIQRKVKKNEKDAARRSCARILFTCLVVIEQIAMTVLIYRFDRLEDVNISILLPLLWGVFILGVVLDGVFHLLMNPWATLSNTYEKRKYALFAFILIIIIGMGAIAFIFVIESRVPLIFLACTIILILSVGLCKRMHERRK